MEPMTTVTAPRPPGRPRSARADGAIIDAVIELLAGGTTVEALTVEAVAAKAGVGKATIYRRWQHKDALVADAVASVKPPLPEVPGNSLREDLTLLAQALSNTRHSAAGRIMPCVIPELHRPGRLRDQYLELIESRRDAVRVVLRRGVDSGELRADTDVDLVVALLTGPTLMSMVGPSPLADRDDLGE